MASIREVAKAANAPISAVSLILNGKPHTYSKKTEERVREAAGRLNYRPKAYAQSMRSGRYNHVAFIMGSHGDSSFHDGLRYFAHEALASRGYRMGLAMTERELFQDDDSIRQFITQWASDGFILCYNYDLPKKLVSYLDRNNIPWVATNMDLAENSIFPKDFEAGQQAVECLYERGHRNIAYIDGLREERVHYSQPARRQGYLEGMAKFGLTARVLSAPQVNLSYFRNEFWPEMLGVSEAERPTAFVTYGHDSAWHLSIAALEKGMEAPRDFSVLSFADHLVRGLDLPISLMRIPFEAVGTRSVEMLLNKIEGENKDLPSIAVEHEFRDHGGIQTIDPNM